MISSVCDGDDSTNTERNLRKTNIFHQLEKKGERINHLIFMDYLKLFVKTPEQLDSLVNSVRKFSADIKMEFGLSKCVVLILKRGKVIGNDRQMIKCIDEGRGYMYVRILKADGVRHKGMKE